MIGHLQRIRCCVGTQAKRSSGFTLIELMIAVALSLFLLAGLQMTYISGRVASQEAEALSRMQENIRFASDYLVRDVRNAGYRDLLALSFEQSRIIGESFAEYGVDNDGAVDQSRLIVRYAGRGACGRVFEEEDLKIIENRYFIDGDGNLVCEGVELVYNDAGVLIEDPNPAVALASGLRSANFQFVVPDGAPATDVCNFHEEDDLETACIGVRMLLVFADEQSRRIELRSAFRNVIVDRIYGR